MLTYVLECMFLFNGIFAIPSHQKAGFISLFFEPQLGQLTSFGQWNIRKCDTEVCKVLTIGFAFSCFWEPFCTMWTRFLKDEKPCKDSLKPLDCLGHCLRHEREAIVDHSTPHELD